MLSQPYKNYLRSARKKLGLNQTELAVILGKSSALVSRLEGGRTKPTLAACVAFRMLFRRTFEDLWPGLHAEMEAAADLRARKLIGRLQQRQGQTARHQMQRRITCRNLAVAINGLPEDLATLE